MSEILGTIDVNNYGLQSMVAGGADLQEKTATPTTSQQVIQADEGYDGLSSVTVNAVTSAIDENIIPTNIRTGKTILGVQGNLEPDKPDQNKTVTPSTSQQTVRADTGYELAQVTVEAMNLQSKDVTINQNGTTTIEADTGYDGLSDVDVTVSGILDTSDATATANDIADGMTAYVNNQKIQGRVPTIYSGGSVQAGGVNISGNTIKFSCPGNYLIKQYGSLFKTKSDFTALVGLTADKLKKDEVVLGVTGTYEGETPTLELYDVLEINHSIGSMFDTGYIANENTEVVVEYEDWYNYASSSKSAYLFGIRYGTKTNRDADSITTSSAFSFNSYKGGSYKFGDKEIESIQMGSFRKNRLKLNKDGIYKYDYTNEDYNLDQSFQTAPMWTNMQDNLILFGEKQILTITGAGETIINYVNVVPVCMKFHFMEIYENGVLKARYVPAKYGNEIGVYDTVAQKMLDRITPLDVYNENN